MPDPYTAVYYGEVEKIKIKHTGQKTPSVSKILRQTQTSILVWNAEHPAQIENLRQEMASVHSYTDSLTTARSIPGTVRSHTRTHAQVPRPQVNDIPVHRERTHIKEQSVCNSIENKRLNPKQLSIFTRPTHPPIHPSYVSYYHRRRNLALIFGILEEKEPTEKIADIWAAYHDERADSLGTVLPGDALDDLREKAKKW